MMFRKSLAVGLVLLMVLSGFTGLIGGTGESNASDAGHLTPVVQAYKSHAPIRINSNADFTSANGVSSGSGTEADPYIIENYDIDGTNAGSCLYIGNTTVHFIVRNCSLHDASGNYYWNTYYPYYQNSGAALYNVTGGILDNNTALMNNGDGIYLYSSDSNTITNNIASSNNACGIFFYTSSSNTITKNKASTNSYGIALYSSSSNTIANNTASSNNNEGILLDASSDSDTIANNTASSNHYHGIYLRSSSSNTIANNTASSNNWAGIYIYSSSSNTIRTNIASNNQDGIHLYSSSSNTIYHNNFINNTNQAYDDTGTNYWNSSYPTGGNYWSDYTGADNYSGPCQNISGPDGIGDTAYNISGGSGAQDNYPLMRPTWYPFIEIISPSEEGIFNVSTVTVSWAGSDARSGIDHYEIRIDGSSWTTVETNTSYTFTGLSDDSHTVDVKVIDNAGNENTTSTSFTTDTTPPTITQHSPTGQNVSVDSTINLTFSEPMNHSTVRIEIYGINGSIAWNNNTATFTPSQNLSYDTNYTVTVTGSDLAGNSMAEYAWPFSTEKAPTTTETGTITGTVTDTNGNPVAGATVTVRGTNITAITDSTGHFLLENVSAGSHNLTVSGDGFNDTVASVTVSEGGTATLNPVLHPMVSQPITGPSNNSFPWWIILVVVAVLIAVGLLMRKKGGKKPLPSVYEETANPEPEDAAMEEPEEITKPARPEAPPSPPQ